MKVVLLAAGRSFRMAPIADKNFLKFFGKFLIVHQIAALKKTGFREILAVGGKHNLKDLKKLGCSVREQKDLDLGMAGAVLTAATWIKNDPFLLISANDIVDESVYASLRRYVKKNEGLMLAAKVKKYFPGGYLKISPRGFISKIVEKPKPGREPSKLVNIVMHYHPQPKALFEALKKISSDRDDRYEQALQILFDRGAAYRALPFSGFWQPVKYPWHVLELMNYQLRMMNDESGKKSKGCEIAKSAKITGNVFLDEGVKVLDNAVIAGPAYVGKNTVIATNALVRQSHIGANCVIGFGSEVARSYVGDGVWTHTNYIGDSVIGDDVSFGAGTATGNLRLDEKSIYVTVTKTWNGKTMSEKVNSGLAKLGLITGDHIRVGINTSFMPGVKIGSNSFIGAGITLGEDVPEGSFVTGDWKLKIRPNRERITLRGKSKIF